MSEQPKLVEPKWSVICKRVRLWEGRPQPGGLRSFLAVGGSDAGYIEYNGSVLRFTGKKLQIEIAAIKSISEVKPDLKAVHFLLYFILLFLFLWLLGSVSLRQSVKGILGAASLALLGTVVSWWYLRKYDRWVWISYAGSDGQIKDIGFWGAPANGGSQRLYHDLATRPVGIRRSP